MKALRLVLAGSLLATAVGCDTLAGADETHKRRIAESEALIEAAKRPGRPAATLEKRVRYSDRAWLGGRSYINPRGERLPVRVEGPGAVVVNTIGRPITVRQLIAEVTSQTGIPIVIDVPDGELRSGATIAAAARPTIAQPGAGAPGLPGAFPDTAPALPAPGGMGGGTGGGAERSTSPLEQSIAIKWNGPLSGLLDYVATYFDLSWNYSGERVYLSNLETRTFSIYALPTTSNMSANFSQSTTSGSGGSGATASAGLSTNATNSVDADQWTLLDESLKNILQDNGVVAVSRAHGTVTVTARPALMRRVESFIEEMNGSSIRQVALTVKVYSIETNDEQTFALDLNSVLRGILGQTDLSVGSPVDLTSVPTNQNALIGVTVVGGGRGPTNAEGSHAILQALQVMGTVSTVAESSVTTLNGQPAPVNVVRNREYLRSFTSESEGSGSDASVSVSTEIGNFTTGLSLNLLPRILVDGRVLMQLAMSLTDGTLINVPVSLPGADANSLTLPDASVRSFLQQVVLETGSTLILSGYQESRDQRSETGRPGVGALLGGSSTGSKNRRMLVITVTPVILASERR